MMTPTPPSTGSSNGQYSPDGQYKVVRKRNRVPLSCAPCRIRKLKCNRSQPCENCVKRGESMGCSYTAPGSRKKSSSSSGSARTPDDMQHRIDRLENLVLSLMTNGAHSAGPAAASRALSMSDSTGSMEYSQDVDVDAAEDDVIKENGNEAESETDQVAQSLGVMKVMDNKSMYFGEVHWAAILSDISEVKNWFAEHKKQYDDQALKVEASKHSDDFIKGPTFLFGGSKLPEYSDILASVPGRLITDKIIARYWNSYDPSIHILHPPSWQRLYDKFWENPSKSEPAWLGQMFAMLCLAMHSYNDMGDEPPEFRGKSLNLAAKYRSLTAQCLIVADFTKPVNHMIEALILHLHGEYARSRDAEVGIWVLVGMIVRLSMRMGYHRDPKYFPNITPFQGEIRRRVWTFVRQSDLLFSFQLGLPNMIRLHDCDTGLPRNLYDDEFDEDTPSLPPSRPASELTPVSYMIAKARTAFVFGRIVETVHSVSSSSYEDIMKLDHLLRETRDELPSYLRLRPMEESLQDPGALLMQRINLSILYSKGQCVLHRKFLARARENPRYAHSRRTCVDSSMDLLHHQATLHYETLPGHRLHGSRVFANSLTTHDFLLAAMIVCLDLCYSAEAEGAGQSSSDPYMWGIERRSEMIKSLGVSKDIWLELKDSSMEAYKASEILTVMIEKLKKNRSQLVAPQLQNPVSYPGANGTDMAQAFMRLPQEDEKPEHSAAMTLGMLSNGGMTPNSSVLFNNPFPALPGTNSTTSEMQRSGLTPQYSMEQSTNGLTFAPNPFPFLSNGMDMAPANLDWEAWDSYIQNSGLDPANQIWPPSMDLPFSPPPPPAERQEDLLQQHPGAYSSSGGVFMGVSTPPGNTM